MRATIARFYSVSKRLKSQKYYKVVTFTDFHTSANNLERLSRMGQPFLIDNKKTTSLSNFNNFFHKKTV